MTHCLNCHKSLNKKPRKSYHQVDDSYYCKPCYKVLYTIKRRNVSELETVRQCELSEEQGQEQRQGQEEVHEQEDRNNSTIFLPIARSHLSHNKCIFNCTDSCDVANLRMLSRKECLEVYIQTNVYIHYTARACLQHWANESFTIPADFSATHNGMNLSSNEILDFMISFKKIITDERNKKISFSSMKDTILEFETGLNKEQFKHVLSFLKDIPVHDNDYVLGVYLSRLRRGYTFDELANRWNITRQTASKYCSLCRNILKAEFVNTYIGLNVCREELCNHQNRVTTRLHVPTGDKVVLVFDGTYIFIEKSSNFAFQKVTFSGHKKRNLIKPFLIVYPDGYIADIWGPYSGNKSDAIIMNEMLGQDVWGSLEIGDVFLLDRGFRDSLELIKERGFIPKMPSFSESPSMPLTTEQANTSRMITKSRYIVEYVNGQIKNRFRYFSATVRNTTLSTMFDDFKIACAIYNSIYTPVVSQTSNAVIDRMLQKQNETNYLKELVVKENLNKKKTMFKPIEEAEVHAFPKLNLDQLILYVSGTYQLRIAASYYAEHVNEHGDFKCDVAVENSRLDYRKYRINIDSANSLLLKAKIHSRHSSSDKYFVYILIDLRLEEIESILGHYCNCKVGSRIVGCCSHVTVVLWYFSYARYLNSISLPASHLTDFFETHNSETNDETDEEN